MSHTKSTLRDAALIISGVGLSTAFISIDGDGQNPVPVAAGMLLIAGLTGVVSFALACFVRTTLLAIVATMVITELAFLLCFVSGFASSTRADAHAAEELSLVPMVFAVVTAPTVLLSSVGFGRIWHRVCCRKTRGNGQSVSADDRGTTNPTSTER